MPIEFPCSQCGKVLRVPDGSGGKQAKCPHCTAVVEVPAAAPPPAGDDKYKVASPEPSPGSQAGVNPFADAKGASPISETSFDPKNPYASPAYSTVTKPRRPSSEERRTGPPWERNGQSAGTFFATVGEVFGQTSSMFSMMRRRGGLGAPMGFAVVGGMIGALANLFYRIVITGIGGVAGGAGPQVAFEEAGPGCATLVCAPLVVILVLFVGSFIVHLMLLLVGGADGGFDTFETTFRVGSYCYGATALLSLIPFIGGCLQWVVGSVFMIIGIASAHEITTGKAAAAVLVPVLVCIVLPLVALLVFAISALARSEVGI
jgi:hypothetical protein